MPDLPGFQPGGAADSAGVPWQGRHFHENPGAGDDGSAPAELLDVFARFHAGDAGPQDVVRVLHRVRLLVPLVARRGDEDGGSARRGDEDQSGARGQLADKTQELSIVTVAGPDGRAVLPAFSSADAMRRWDPKARPIPVEASRVALAAASEGTELVVVDPASDTEFAVRRPALRAMATGERWTPSYADPDVAEALTHAIEPEPAALALAPHPGDPGFRLAGPELLVALAVVPGLSAPELQDVLNRISARWSGDALIAERVDSLGVRVTASG